MLAFQSPGLSKHSSVTLCSSPSALGRSRWHVSTFSSLFDYWSCKPGLQACMQLVGSGYYSKLIFIIFMKFSSPLQMGCCFSFREENVPCVLFIFTISEVKYFDPY